MHPLAIKGRNGGNGMKAGDRVRYTINGLTGIANEFLHNGDALITWDDGTFETVKRAHLTPESPFIEGAVTDAYEAGYRPLKP